MPPGVTTRNKNNLSPACSLASVSRMPSKRACHVCIVVVRVHDVVAGQVGLISRPRRVPPAPEAFGVSVMLDLAGKTAVVTTWMTRRRDCRRTRRSGSHGPVSLRIQTGEQACTVSADQWLERGYGSTVLLSQRLRQCVAPKPPLGFWRLRAWLDPHRRPTGNRCPRSQVSHLLRFLW